MAQLLKADHPRAIDRYIDFFGDGVAQRPGAPDLRALPADLIVTLGVPGRFVWALAHAAGNVWSDQAFLN